MSMTANWMACRLRKRRGKRRSRYTRRLSRLQDRGNFRLFRSGSGRTRFEESSKSCRCEKARYVPLKDLTKETGYVRGGCSAVGMKKKYPTVIDKSAEELDRMIVSAGKPGLQMKLSPIRLATVTEASFMDIVKD